YRFRINRLHAEKLERIVFKRTKQLEEMNEGLTWLANHDSLTRLPNRNQVHQKMSQFDANCILGIIVIDLDYFKSVNDQHGHAAGDLALQAFADMLALLVHKNQIACRWGGEEFLIICPNISKARLVALVQQVLDHCRQLQVEISEHQTIQLKCSIGCAMTPAPPQKQLRWEKTIQLADMALYDAKHSGRDRAIAYLWHTQTHNKQNINWVLANTEQAFKDKILEKLVLAVIA
ncbi:MAG TPA: GGDEF domain-containing protein, partial [Oceanospirillales bacterium]|nr:GGDEF domain-containing protein [Oceanospirillales bacterium]